MSSKNSSTPSNQGSLRGKSPNSKSLQVEGNSYEEVIPHLFRPFRLAQKARNDDEEETASETSVSDDSESSSSFEAGHAHHHHHDEHKKKLALRGQLLWKQLLQTRSKVSHGIPGSTYNVSVRDETQAQKAAMLETLQSSIVIMDGNNDACQKVLDQFPGAAVCTISDTFVAALKRHTPAFHATVADFNNNLSYAMQSKNLSNLVAQDKHQTNQSKAALSPQDHNDHEDYTHSLQYQLTHELNVTLSTTIGGGGPVEYQGSFMQTETTVPQPPHVDYEWDILQDPVERERLHLSFFSLTDQGMFLQVWPTAQRTATTNNDHHDEVVVVPGILLFIPLGSLLCMPSDTVHAGGFRSCPHTKNLRFHLYVATHGATLPDHQNNRYTEPNDHSRELAERYQNHPQIDQLCQILFV
jgi:hypothetical protein